MILRTTLLLTVALGALSALSHAQVGTDVNDFKMPGTQPGDLNDPIQSVTQCTFCHAYYDPDDEPYERWAGSMMANSMRDPMFHAALAVANQDATDAGEFCLRCHTPGGWLAGNSSPPSGSALGGQDYEGVNCNFCHRLVDPIPGMGNPTEDAAILAALADAPTDFHSGQFVIDPDDIRRGPFDLGMGFLWHDWLESPLHQESNMCGTCHDVSNPVYKRNGGATPSASDSYDLDTLLTEHPDSNDKLEQFPIERTYTEWSLSDFAVAPIDMMGRFGGNNTLVSSCQDCHMPDTTGGACDDNLGPVIRTDLPQHDFAGANSWVPEAVYRLDQSLALYTENETNGEPLSVFQNAVARNISMLQRACDLELSLVSGDLNVRIVNQSGHKLPTGYGEGRRMWINVQYLDPAGGIVREYGHYDSALAELDESDTKVYQIEQGLDANAAMATGLPAGPSFHFALNNTINFDNRIPPRGFNNAAFEAGQANPVGYSYADGEYWDDTLFDVHPVADRVRVTVYHQTTTKEYVEFLRDENVTNSAGTIAYNEWVAGGKSAPVAMATATLRLSPNRYTEAGGRTSTLPVGQSHVLPLDAGERFAGAPFLVLGSTSGTAPSNLAGVQIPLSFDAYTEHTLLRPDAGPLYGARGVLDERGRGQAVFRLDEATGQNLRQSYTHVFVYTDPETGGLVFGEPSTVSVMSGRPGF